MNLQCPLIILLLLGLNGLYAQDVEILYPFDYTTDFEDIFVATGGRGFAVGTCGQLATTLNGTDWTVSTGPDLADVPSMVTCAPGTNCSEVWIGGGNELLHSTDGGTTWNTQVIEGLSDPREIHFLGDNTLVVSHSSASVLRSTDGGQSWAVVELAGSYRGTADFVSNELGFLLDQSNNLMLSTTDQGSTWDTVTTFTERPLYLDMIDSQVGYIVLNVRSVSKTTDGGQTWTSANDNVSANPRVIVAFDENNLMMSSFPSSLVLSTDGGINWTTPAEPLEDDAYGLRLNNLHRNGDQVWIASDASSILYSTDALATRTNLFPADRESIETIQFGDVNTGYALCERRGFFKTNDGGDNWTRVITNFGTVSRDMLVRSTEDIIIPYNSSGPQRSLDGGENWSALFPAEIQDTTSVFQVTELPNGRLYLMGGQHGVWSDDNGQTWEVVYHGLGGFADMLYFYDNQLGFAGGQGGRLYRTADGGESWTSISQGDITNQPIRNIYMRDAMNGFINISSTTYCTNDGGLTWNANLCAGYNPPNVVLEAPNGHLYSTRRSGDNQFISVSEDQGLTWTEIQEFCTNSNALLGFTPDSRYLFGGWSGSLITRLDLDLISSTQALTQTNPQSLKLMPNPATGQTHLVLPDNWTSQQIDIRLFSANGQQVGSYQSTNDRQPVLHLSDLPDGLYFVHIRADVYWGQAKLIKH